MQRSFDDLVPRLSDGVVTLRAHRLADASGITEQCLDPVSVEWTTAPRGYTEDMARGWVGLLEQTWRDDSGDRAWAIEADGRFAGTIELRYGGGTSAEIAYGLHPDFRGRGLLGRAITVLCDYAFETGPWGGPLTRIHWRAIVGNWPSRRVAWRAGFTFHATVPELLTRYGGDTLVSADGWQASLAATDSREPKTRWLMPPTLRGNGIHLRAFRGDEGPDQEARNDPPHWFPSPHPISPETFAARFLRWQTFAAEGSAMVWCIADAQTDRALGMVNVFGHAGDDLTGDAAELGYQLNPSARGRGVAKEAARLAVEFATRPTEDGGLGLRRLVAETAADNEASNAVLRSVGFTEYGRAHAMDALPDGTYGDALFWERLTPSR